MPPNPEIFVLGDSWTARAVLHAFHRHGGKAQGIFIPEKSSSGTISIHLGNGESYQRARLAFGDDLARALWDFSRHNYQRAQDRLEDIKVPYRQQRLLRFAGSAKEQVLLEKSSGEGEGYRWLREGAALTQGKQRFLGCLSGPAVSFSSDVFSQTVDKICPVTFVDEISAVSQKEPFDLEVHYRYQGGPSTTPASIIVVVSEQLVPLLGTFFADKIIPVTLSSFTYRRLAGPDFSLALFNGGVDFASAEKENLRLGSFRNLFEDRAVGVQDSPDPVTEKGVREFFGSMGWIDPQQPAKSNLMVEAISCDGLPVVGSIPEAPGIYVLGGFSGRSANYIFEMAEQLSQGILGNKSFEGLAKFSSKRFV
jgi:hypothetical protein